MLETESYLKSNGYAFEFGTSSGLPFEFVKSMRTLFDMMDDTSSGRVAFSEIERRWRDDAVPNLPGVLEALRIVAPNEQLLTFEDFVNGLSLALRRVRAQHPTRCNDIANQTLGEMVVC